jgi:hypothetical protein
MNSPERLPTETQAVHRLPVGRVGRAHLSLPFADSRCGARRRPARSSGALVLQPSR